VEHESGKGSILVVDDSPLVLDVVRAGLEEGGYRVSTGSSWVEVNVELKRERPDLILLDIQMPSIGGESLCRILKESPTFGEIPVVLFSSLEAEEIRRLAGESGADGWIRKRMGPGEVLEDVEREYRRLVPGESGSTG
jgi:CheY-like chemotaxis protein